MKPYRIASIIAIGLIVWSMTSCTVHLGADGSKTGTIDGTGAATAIIAAGKVLADK